VYVPLELGGPGALSLAIHSDVDPASLIDPLARELGRLAPTSPQHWISTMEGELALQYRDAQLYATLSSVCGISAALLAVLGLSSMLSHHVARRRRELGVRLAMGARAADVAGLVLVEGARTLTIGVLVGAAIALAGTRLLAGLLYGVVANDPLTYVLVGAGIVASGLLASAVPALRAGRIDPLRALRAE
jgi:ABC-type antimicrobial peptide transport system permease subunit